MYFQNKVNMNITYINFKLTFYILLEGKMAVESDHDLVSGNILAGVVVGMAVVQNNVQQALDLVL